MMFCSNLTLMHWQFLIIINNSNSAPLHNSPHVFKCIPRQSTAVLCQSVSYSADASVRPPSGSLCNICPAVLYKCPCRNGSTGNVETACLRHTSLIYMSLPEGRSRLAGFVIYDFLWKELMLERWIRAQICGNQWMYKRYKHEKCKDYSNKRPIRLKKCASLRSNLRGA